MASNLTPLQLAALRAHAGAPGAPGVHAVLQSLGFSRRATGGGCEVFEIEIGRFTVWITDTDDTAALPHDPEELYVGIYQGDHARTYSYSTLSTVLAWSRLASHARFNRPRKTTP